MIVLKICGMRCVEDVRMCAGAGADALGFVFADGPRRLELDEAAHLTAATPAAIRRVGVFANQPRALVEAALKRCDLDVLQFAGDEAPEFCGSFGLPTLITARESAPALDMIQRARAIGVIADARVDGCFGGSGKRVDPHVARTICEGTLAPFILAGGLTPENVCEAILMIGPDGVDVSSGVERNGSKDAGLVAAFARSVRQTFAARTGDIR